MFWMQLVCFIPDMGLSAAGWDVSVILGFVTGGEQHSIKWYFCTLDQKTVQLYGGIFFL